jgi:hypothetical protein
VQLKINALKFGIVKYISYFCIMKDVSAIIEEAEETNVPEAKQVEAYAFQA